MSILSITPCREGVMDGAARQAAILSAVSGYILETHKNHFNSIHSKTLLTRASSDVNHELLCQFHHRLFHAGQQKLRPSHNGYLLVSCFDKAYSASHLNAYREQSALLQQGRVLARPRHLGNFITNVHEAQKRSNWDKPPEYNKGIAFTNMKDYMIGKGNVYFAQLKHENMKVTADIVEYVLKSARSYKGKHPIEKSIKEKLDKKEDLSGDEFSKVSQKVVGRPTWSKQFSGMQAIAQKTNLVLHLIATYGLIDSKSSRGYVSQFLSNIDAIKIMATFLEHGGKRAMALPDIYQRECSIKQPVPHFAGMLDDPSMMMQIWLKPILFWSDIIWEGIEARHSHGTHMDKNSVQTRLIHVGMLNISHAFNQFGPMLPVHKSWKTLMPTFFALMGTPVSYGVFAAKTAGQETYITNIPLYMCILFFLTARYIYEEVEEKDRLIWIKEKSAQTWVSYFTGIPAHSLNWSPDSPSEEPPERIKQNHAGMLKRLLPFDPNDEEEKQRVLKKDIDMYYPPEQEPRCWRDVFNVDILINSDVAKNPHFRQYFAASHGRVVENLSIAESIEYLMVMADTKKLRADEQFRALCTNANKLLETFQMDKHCEPLLLSKPSTEMKLCSRMIVTDLCYGKYEYWEKEKTTWRKKSKETFDDVQKLNPKSTANKQLLKDFLKNLPPIKEEIPPKKNKKATAKEKKRSGKETG
jgi:hypothetical protein